MDAHAAIAILLETAAVVPGRSWLVPGGEAALAWGLAEVHPDVTIHWQPVDVRERSALDDPPGNLRIGEPVANPGRVDAVVLLVPPDRDLARRWLLLARSVIGADGRLVLAGANAEGIRSVIGDAEALFGSPLYEAYRSKQRVAIFTAGTGTEGIPGWADESGVAPGTWREMSLALRGREIPLVTQAGVFAGDRIDPGTRLLLDALPERIDGAVLDLGCGIGAIGIVALLLGSERVDMTDVNLLAVQAATENLHRLGLSGVRPLAGDVYDAVGAARYDLIVSNPPFHRGKAVDLSVADRLIDDAPAHLAVGGSLLLVANAFLAYGKRMTRVFRDVETIAATRQYHVIRASAPR